MYPFSCCHASNVSSGRQLCEIKCNRAISMIRTFEYGNAEHIQDCHMRCVMNGHVVCCRIWIEISRGDWCLGLNTRKCCEWHAVQLRFGCAHKGVHVLAGLQYFFDKTLIRKT